MKKSLMVWFIAGFVMLLSVSAVASTDEKISSTAAPSLKQDEVKIALKTAEDKTLPVVFKDSSKTTTTEIQLLEPEINTEVIP
jgi:hypothetical protein